MRDTVLREGWSERRGAFTGVLGEDGLDASVLLMALVGMVDARDERMRRTCDALQAALGRDGLLRRSEERSEEAAFLPAAFMLAASRTQAGDPAAARAVFDRAAAYANGVGLLPEMADPGTRTRLGSVPQAITQIALVTAARCIGEAEKEAA